MESGGGGGVGGDKSKKRNRSKIRRKKSDRPPPRLTIIGVDQDGEVVECQLESGLVSKVSFQFNRDCDRPEDIAALLVRVRALCLSL